MFNISKPNRIQDIFIVNQKCVEFTIKIQPRSTKQSKFVKYSQLRLFPESFQFCNLLCFFGVCFLQKWIIFTSIFCVFVCSMKEIIFTFFCLFVSMFAETDNIHIYGCFVLRPNLSSHDNQLGWLLPGDLHYYIYNMDISWHSSIYFCSRLVYFSTFLYIFLIISVQFCISLGDTQGKWVCVQNS